MRLVSEHSRSFWERNAARYDRSMALLGGPMPRTLALTAEAVRSSGRVLEIACGTGLVTEVLAGSVGELLATDYASAMVERTRLRVKGHANVRCEQRDLYALGEPPSSFDAVVAANVLHLVPDLEGALRAMRVVLRPGGNLVVPTFCHAQSLGARLVSLALSLVSFPGQRRFSLDALCEAVQREGFVIRAQELVLGPLPIGFISVIRGD